MVVKLIRCPSCGEELELTDMYEGMEINCDLCNLVMVVQKGMLHVLDTNEIFSIDDLTSEEVEDTQKMEIDEFEEEEYYDYGYED